MCIRDSPRAGVDQPTHPATANPVRSTVSFDLTATATTAALVARFGAADGGGRPADRVGGRPGSGRNDLAEVVPAMAHRVDPGVDGNAQRAAGQLLDAASGPLAPPHPCSGHAAMVRQLAPRLIPRVWAKIDSNCKAAVQVGGPPGDRTPNPRIKRERVSRSRCAELRKHAQHESLGALRFHLYYTVTRHKTCHVSGSYISATIRARSTSSRAVTAPACAGCRGHLDRLDDPAGGGAAQRGPVRVGELGGHREVVADLPEHLWHPRPPGPRSPRSTASGALAGVKPH